MRTSRRGIERGQAGSRETSANERAAAARSKRPWYTLQAAQRRSDLWVSSDTTKMAGYSIDPDELLARGERLHASYVSADPYPHAVIDDFFPPHVVEAVLASFPRPSDLEWLKFDRAQEKKLASNKERSLPDAVRQLIWEMNSQVFLQFLQNLTGIEGLLPDPRMQGGGMHQIERGGQLGIHVDFNRHGVYKLDRRLNVLLYLNKDWSEDYGGHFELWDRQVERCVRRVLPIFNRLVVFSTTETSWHGHPDPLTCPEDRTRKSLALYYYTNGCPESDVADKHTTKFRTRPGETVKKQREPLRLRDFVPPALTRWRSR